MSEGQTVQVFQIPALRDNYIYILHEKTQGETAVIDPSLAKPVNDFLSKNNLRLDFIWNTHHHWDHTGGNGELKKKWNCPVYGYKEDAFRIPEIDKTLEEGEVFYFGKTKVEVLFIPGHTLGHIAFWLPVEKYLFCGDTLFSLGCGRLFEGTPEMMFGSLQKIKNLPPDTQIYCAHEYTEDNARFALSVDTNNKELQKRAQAVKLLRQKNQPTVPSSLKEELAANPFLKAKTSLEFKILREKKDCF